MLTVSRSLILIKQCKSWFCDVAVFKTTSFNSLGFSFYIIVQLSAVSIACKLQNHNNCQVLNPLLYVKFFVFRNTFWQSGGNLRLSLQWMSAAGSWCIYLELCHTPIHLTLTQRSSRTKALSLPELQYIQYTSIKAFCHLYTADILWFLSYLCTCKASRLHVRLLFLCVISPRFTTVRLW